MSLTFENRINNLERFEFIDAGATLTVNASQHAGRAVRLNVAAGSVVTLPAATGTGNQYFFLVTTTVTSNASIVKVANATDVMAGIAAVGATTSGTFATAAASDTISMNGTTTGGIIGSYIEVVDVASGIFRVAVYAVGSGTAVTVFSATV